MDRPPALPTRVAEAAPREAGEWLWRSEAFAEDLEPLPRPEPAPVVARADAAVGVVRWRFWAMQ